MRLPPHIDRPDESLLAKCERIKRELQAASRPAAPRAANDNAADPDEGGVFWWLRW